MTLKWKWVSVFIVIIGLLSAVIMVRSARRTARQRHLESVRQDLEVEIQKQLVIGKANPDQVQGYLSTKRLKSSGIYLNNDQPFVEKTIEAQTQSYEGPNSQCSIHIVFAFDERDILESTKYNYSCYGP